MPIAPHWQLIRNRFHVYGNPIGVAKMERVYDLLDLPTGARVLDVGCGKGEVLIRLAERFGARTVGIDPSPVLQMARDAAAARVPDGDLVWHSARLDEVALEPGRFDVTVCIGARHAFAGQDDMFRGLRDLTRPGGFVLIGDGFNMQDPGPEYLAALGGEPFAAHDNVGTIAAGEAAGLTSLYNTISSRDEWDDFEWLYLYAMEQHRAEHGLTPEQAELLADSRRFHAAQLRWGRDTMGFALYLYRRPADE